MTVAGSRGQRLDHALVARGLARSRSQARDLILRGCVAVDGNCATKPGQLIHDADEMSVAAGAQPYVSRGGLKLAAALDAFALSPLGRACLDIGASTGGFTDVLLRRGAARVWAVDVGHGQLHASLASDARVVRLEGVDARQLGPAEIKEPVGAIVADVSFISLTQALTPALGLAAHDAWLVALIKPQFEAGRAHIGKGGIVRSEETRQAAVARVREWLDQQQGWCTLGVIASPIAGGSGNREFLIGARRGG